MKKYLDHIENSNLVGEVESALTTGGLEYPGTALEITTANGEELFHVVVDSKGNRQILFYAHQKDYRLPLDLMEKIVVTAKEKVFGQTRFCCPNGKAG